MVGCAGASTAAEDHWLAPKAGRSASVVSARLAASGTEARKVHAPEALQPLASLWLDHEHHGAADRLRKGVISEHGVGKGDVDQAARQVDRAAEVVASPGEDLTERQARAGRGQVARRAGVDELDRAQSRLFGGGE